MFAPDFDPAADRRPDWPTRLRVSLPGAAMRHEPRDDSPAQDRRGRSADSADRAMHAPRTGRGRSRAIARLRDY
jgi:hypothetical protein